MTARHLSTKALLSRVEIGHESDPNARHGESLLGHKKPMIYYRYAADADGIRDILVISDAGGRTFPRSDVLADAASTAFPAVPDFKARPEGDSRRPVLWLGEFIYAGSATRSLLALTSYTGTIWPRFTRRRGKDCGARRLVHVHEPERYGVVGVRWQGREFKH